VFAAGDVRAGATQRVAGAVGDGSLAVRFAHQVLGGQAGGAMSAASTRAVQQ
jgi:thioredoxin reductase (NADPH)